MNRYMRGMSNGGSIVGRINEPLTNDQLMAAVPSVFATEAHESRSARFAPIPTIQVVEGLRREGFEPFFAQQARTRVPGKAAFTKHMLRMRHRSLINARGDSFEIILVNANDGTSAYQMLPGFFRFVCANGLFTGETFDEVKVRHSGNAIDDVIEGAYTVLENAPLITDQVDRWKGVKLTDGEMMAMAEAAHILRFPAAYAEPEGEEAEAPKPAPIEARTLLRPRRYDDNASDLWMTFNRVQENVIKGGQRGMTVGSNGRSRRASVRAVGGIDQSKALNRALWTLTERMAELKNAA